LDIAVAGEPEGHMMPARRDLFLLPALSALIPARGVRAGDWVRVVALPRSADESSPNPALADFGLKCRLCLGKRCRVIYVDESGRPELDIFEHVRSRFPSLIGCSASFDAECLRVEESAANRGAGPLSRAPET